VELDVGHVVACTWHWFSPKCHGLVDRCVEFVQQIEWPCLPQFEHGTIPLVLRKWVELHQLGSMVGTPNTPGKDCG